ncbi:hypothetical protein R1flu_019012 [Riccia fluitans]|uniref:Uncharacterized protein n=1 Tax=Riccia fluitans TaxID=41844 RepID=A0ABD1ZLC1_9MARC
MDVGEPRSQKKIFQNGGIGNPPPYPRASDIMLASHGSQCNMKHLEFCVIREVNGLRPDSDVDNEVDNESDNYPEEKI